MNRLNQVESNWEGFESPTAHHLLVIFLGGEFSPEGVFF